MHHQDTIKSLRMRLLVNRHQQMELRKVRAPTMKQYRRIDNLRLNENALIHSIRLVERKMKAA